MKTPKPGWKLTQVEDVPEGCCFVKCTAGTAGYAYLRISDSTAKFHGMSPDKVYGVCYNGNMASVDRGKDVWLVPLSQMDANRRDLGDWEAAMGCKESSPYAIRD